jgi:hypothetical protein
MTTTVSVLPLLCGTGLLVLLIVLAGVVQWRRPPADGTSLFVFATGFVVLLAILALFTRGGA